MYKNKILKFSGNMLVMAFIFPAIIFWVLFCYSGYCLEGFLSFSAFMLHGYQVADDAARHVVIRSLLYLYFGFLCVFGLLMLLLKPDVQADTKNNG